MKSATVIAYSTGLNEGQNHWVTLSSKILSYACEPGVSQEGYRAPDVRLPEQFSLTGKLRVQYPEVILCHVCGVHHSSYKCWKNASLLQIKKQQRGAAVSKSSLINAM
ncbi:hypothetical protein R515_17955 [Salmonella enterica subsp. arizonae serovar 41:z4,z23:-]|nr:hypothetical protein R515_17955 [Salmonella enterica subsp. arizonae serovar 41:z4,z23:-]